MKFYSFLFGALLCFAQMPPVAEAARETAKPEPQTASTLEKGVERPVQPDSITGSASQETAPDPGVNAAAVPAVLEGMAAKAGTPESIAAESATTSVTEWPTSGSEVAAPPAQPNQESSAAKASVAGSTGTESAASARDNAAVSGGPDAPVVPAAASTEAEHIPDPKEGGIVSDEEAPQAGDFQSEIIHSDPEIHGQEHAAAAGDEPAEDHAASVGNTTEGRVQPEQGKAEGAQTQSVEVEPGRNGAEAESAATPQTDPRKSAAINGAQDSERIAPAVPAEGPVFPTSPLIERQIEFWIKIFTEIQSDQGLIHDTAFTLPIYAEVNLESRTRRQQRRYLKRLKRKVERNLRQLAKALRTGEEPDEEGRTLLARLPRDVTPKEIRELSRGVRFQRGLADRFREGLMRSGAVLEEVKRLLVRQGVPSDLAYLPHVESSYNLRGYSKYGAAGIWQFTRGTGRKFLTIKYEVDERLDPLRATHAAALFLRNNFDRLGSWPLAITAYNHGPQGIERIILRKGTRDLSTLISICGCRRFKFASKNFYAEFLAARKVAINYQAYFGSLDFAPKLQFNEVPMPFYLEFAKALDILGIGEARLRKLNPALRAPVIIGSKYIPKGYRLRVPPRVKPEQFVKSVPQSYRMKRQKLTEVALVRRGDTLYGLGRRFGVSWRVIARANNITAYHRIRPGQRLVIPRRGKAQKPWSGDAVAKVDIGAARRVAARRAASLGNGRPLAARMNGESSGIAFQRAEGAYLFQNFDINRYDAESGTGVIESAYGETLGHYAEWAGVSTRAIRRYNRRYRGMLRPGDRVVIPLHRVSLESFSQDRFEYHQSREEDFFSTYGVAEVIKVKVRRGDTVWHIAQSNNVPMWLFYQQNPRLLKGAVRAGARVDLPVIEALSELQEARRANPR